MKDRESRRGEEKSPTSKEGVAESMKVKPSIKKCESHLQGPSRVFRKVNETRILLGLRVSRCLPGSTSMGTMSECLGVMPWEYAYLKTFRMVSFLTI